MQVRPPVCSKYSFETRSVRGPSQALGAIPGGAECRKRLERGQEAVSRGHLHLTLTLTTDTGQPLQGVTHWAARRASSALSHSGTAFLWCVGVPTSSANAGGITPPPCPPGTPGTAIGTDAACVGYMSPPAAERSTDNQVAATRGTTNHAVGASQSRCGSEPIT
eukprot:741308-Prorocentrum_minimum.AAC.1